MKILHINCNYLGSTLHQLMIEKLERLGIENDVYVPTYDVSRAIIKPNKNVIVSECFNKWDRLVFDYKQSKILRDIEEKIDIKQYDLVHAYTLFTDGNSARILSEKYGIPFVVAVRNTDVNDFFKKLFWLRNRGIKTMSCASRVFFLSNSYWHFVRTKYVSDKIANLLKEKISIIPNGIDDFWLKNKFSKKEHRDNIVRLIYAGRVDRNKNIPSIQVAMEILSKKGIDTELTVIGAIDDEKEFSKIKGNKNTKYYPKVEKEELIRYYRESDIFVMPSYTESFGLVYAEAMSQGLPVIYSKGQGFDNQFSEGKVGFHVDARSPESIAIGIQKVLDNYDYISSKTSRLVDKFQWKEIAKKYVNIYTSCKRNN